MKETPKFELEPERPSHDTIEMRAAEIITIVINAFRRAAQNGNMNHENASAQVFDRKNFPGYASEDFEELARILEVKR